MTKSETHITRQAKRLSAGQIDRRRFVMQALATGVTMPTAMSLASRAEAARPKAGGTLRYGVSSQSDLRRYLSLACRDRLVELDADGTPTGALAETFWSDDHGQTWVFNLRDGITFHSGREMTASDVAWTLQRAVQGSRLAQGLARLVDRIDSVDPGTLVVKLNAPHFGLPALLAEPDFSVGPAPSDVADGKTWDGTGPYCFKDLEENNTIELVRVPDAWHPARGHFARVRLRVMSDPRARQSAIMNGDVDVVDQIDPRGLAMLAQFDEIEVNETRGPLHLRLDLPSDGPWSTPGIRDKIDALIDREGLLERHLMGHGHAGSDGIKPSISGDATGDARLAIAYNIQNDNAECLSPYVSDISEICGTGGLEFVPQADGETSVMFSLSRVVGEAAVLEELADAAWPGSVEKELRAAWAIENKEERLLRQEEVLRSRDDVVRPLRPVWINDLVASRNGLKRPAQSTGAPDDIITSRWFSQPA